MAKLRRDAATMVPLCHWCGIDLPEGRPGVPLPQTSPEFTRWPLLPAGTGVRVCGEACSKRPEGAPVGSYARTRKT